jgi:pectinesterase
MNIFLPSSILRAAVTALLLMVGNADANSGRFLKKDDVWFRSDEAKRIAGTVLTWQAPNGAWPKNGETTEEGFTGDVATLKGTFDNGATRDEIRLLGRVFAATGDKRFRDGALRGITVILEAQGERGGWPQSFPPDHHYSRHITLNDGTMVGLLELLREVAGDDPGFRWVDKECREAARRAVARGVECLLDCQVVVDGRRTVWCAQHDERNLRPRPARAFELVSLSGGESAGVLGFLMRLGATDARTVGAIEDGAAWFEAVRISGWREEKRDGNKVMVEDKNAPPLWARFYEIGTNRPIFAGRDSVKRYRMEEIEYERRNGYSWYNHEGDDVAREFARWKRKWPNRPAAAPPVIRDPLAPPLVVAEDGSGDFRKVGEAVAAAPDGAPERVAIYIQPGSYREAVRVPETKPNLAFLGGDTKETRRIWGRGEMVSAVVAATLTVEGDGFSAENLRVVNDFGPGVPAPALRVAADRVVLKACRFEGWKHTLVLEKGRHYFERCTISGHLDFVAGEATAWFGEGELQWRASGSTEPAGGFVFSGMKIKGGKGVTIPGQMRERVNEFTAAENVLGGKDGWNPVP